MSGLLAAYARGDALPAANDDNWSEDLDGINGHTPHDIRRAAWKAVVAGGIGFSVRHNTLYCPVRSPSAIATSPSSPWIRNSMLPRGWPW